MTRLFFSHSAKDDDSVRELRATLAEHGHDRWTDSCEIRGGDRLSPEIQQAIEDAEILFLIEAQEQPCQPPPPERRIQNHAPGYCALPRTC